MSKHFEDKNALEHVQQKRLESVEVHGTEMPGHLAAGADAARETAFVMLLFWLILIFVHTPSLTVLAAFGLGWSAWKGGRSGWLGWSRLERLHRLIEQEKYEIEHHRPQEKEELIALYQEKGFEGKLLEDVVDVLMADQDRLLKVMLEEEMGLTLEAHEHPLQQAFGAVIGSLIAVGFCSLAYFLFPRFGMWIAAFILLTTASVVSARHEKNNITAAVIWNLSIASLGVGVAYFLYKVLI